MSNELNTSRLASTQANKYQTANDALEQLDLALTAFLAVDLTGGNVTVAGADYTRNAIFLIQNASVASRSVTLPATKRVICLRSSTGTTQIVDIKRGTTTLTLAVGESAFFYTDGTANGLIKLTASALASFLALTDAPSSYSGQARMRVRVNGAETAVEFALPYKDIAAQFGGTPAATTIVMERLTSANTFTLIAGLADSRARANTAPSADTDFDLQKNGSSIGTMSFASGSNTATFTMASSATFAAGDRFSVVSPAALNGIADLSMTFGAIETR